MFITKTSKASSVTIKKWQLTGFRLICGLLVLGFVAVAGGEYLQAWILREPSADIHLWHIAELVAMMIILLGGVLVFLLRKPQEKTLLAQFVIVSLTIVAVGVMPFEIKAAALFVIIALLVATYPSSRALLSFSREGSLSKSLLVLTVLVGIFLAPVASHEIQLQIVGMTQNDVHALSPSFHWIGSAVMMMLLVLAGSLAATRRTGWKELGVITGVTYCFLGVTAMIVPGYAGSWGNTGGLFAIIAGVWYIILTLAEAHMLREAQQEAQRARLAVSTPEPASAIEAVPASTT